MEYWGREGARRAREMPIPTTRTELVGLVQTSWEKLATELDAAGAQVADLVCVDDWTAKDLLSVRAWWTERVVDWIEAGRRGEQPVTPACGYRWRETPRLNADVVEAARGQTYALVRRRLEQGCRRVLEVVAELSDDELFGVQVFGWAGSWPVARWISVNTAGQYTTARSQLRRALRAD